MIHHHNINKMVLGLFGVVLAAGVCGACVTPAQQKTQDLMMTSRQFSSDLRWGRYDEVASNFVPAEGQLFLSRVELIEGELVVADEEVSSVKIGNDGNSATSLVRLQWYTHRNPVVRTTVIEQAWVHEGRWLVKSQKRLRGERFPLVLEPTQTATDKEADATPDQPENQVPDPDDQDDGRTVDP